MDTKQKIVIRQKIKETLPMKLKFLRAKNKFTQRYAAEKLGISYQTYQAYEKGRALPKVRTIVKISYLYEVSTDYLLGHDCN